MADSDRDDEHPSTPPLGAKSTGAFVNARAPVGRPRPSFYVRAMPLMYGLIGATAALFLHALFCGRPVASPGTKCKPSIARKAPSKPTRRPQVVAASSSSSKVSHAVASDHAPAKPAPVKPDPAKPDPAKPDPTPAAVKRVPARPPAQNADGPSPAPTVDAQLMAAIAPCVRAQARSFRVAVRLAPDGKVRRVFVARDPGVNATMSGCIRRQVVKMTLPLKLPRPGYAEWRVRQNNKTLSLTLVRPARLRQR